MSEQLESVDNLRKVKLLIKASKKDGGSEGSHAGEPYEFIFGIGSGGLSLVEMELQGLRQGGKVTLEVTQENLGEFFGHLQPPSLPELEKGARLSVTMIVEEVARAGQREIVQAMSDTAACGSDCCSHH